MLENILKIRKYGRERQDTTGKVTAFTQETLSGIFVIKAFNNTDFVIDKYKDLTKEEFEQAYKTTKIKAKVSPINEVITTFMVLLVVLYGGYQILVTKNYIRRFDFLCNSFGTHAPTIKKTD